MRVLYDIFKGREVKFTLTVRSASPTEDRQNSVPVNQPLIKTWETPQEKTQYLIYSPKFGLRVSSARSSKDSVVVPAHLIYQLGGLLESVYNKIFDTNWYSKDDGKYYVDKEEAGKIAKRMSLFNTNLVVYPSLVTREYLNGVVPGVQLSSNSAQYGDMTHEEVLALISAINHLDITSLNLAIGTLDKLEIMDRKIDALLRVQGIDPKTIEGVL